MRYDIVLSGVGGQGILSIAGIVDRVALRMGYELKQAEVHGMAQRGGAVESHLRISDGPIASDIIPAHSADLIISVEPMEALRHLPDLSENGTVVTSIAPFLNTREYPAVEEIFSALSRVRRLVLVDSRTLAREAGNSRTENIVILGAASPFLPLPVEFFGEEIGRAFLKLGERVVEANRRAFELGRGIALARA